MARIVPDHEAYPADHFRSSPEKVGSVEISSKTAEKTLIKTAESGLLMVRASRGAGASVDYSSPATNVRHYRFLVTAR